MKRRRTRKCVHCGELYEVDVRNVERQKCCGKGVCRAALKAARQRRWLERPENRDYFRGPVHVERVRAWRARHPGYWRRTLLRPPDALQDAHARQAADPAGDPGSLPAAALQDVLRLQGPVLIGLIAHLADTTLQDDIAAAGKQLLQLGQDILGGRSSDAGKARAAP
jgi:hypothetical protein